MSLLDELSEAAANAAASVEGSVVRIGQAGGRGCGLVLTDGLVVTNAHNLRGDTTTVTFAGAREVQGEKVGEDLDGDLVVLRADTGDAPAFQWADSSPRAGQAIFSVARAALGGVRVSFGIVSGTERAFRGPRGRRIKGSIEHTAPLLHGSSGSPVVDSSGAVVGINTNRLGDGFYLALPADAELRSRLDALAAGKSRERRRLGVGLAPAKVARALRRSVGLPERDGLLVRAVEEGSPAAAAGIQQGDLLVAAGGSPVVSLDDLHDALDRAGNTLALRIVRGAEELDLVVQLGPPS